MSWQRISFIILIIVVVGGGYYYYNGYSTTPTSDISESTNPIVTELSLRLNEIRPLAFIEIDTSIFDNELISSLKPIIATSGPAVVPGRFNPFVPF